MFYDITKQIYRLLGAICKNNENNEIYCLQYFGIFKKHVGIIN